jgi:hypothetical protein
MPLRWAHVRRALVQAETDGEGVEVQRTARYLLLLLDGVSDTEARDIVWPVDSGKAQEQTDGSKTHG